MKKKPWKRIGTLFLAFALIFSSLGLDTTEVQAATKAKSISVTTKNSSLGSTKTIYVGGPSSLKTLNIKAKVKPAKASQKVTYKSSKKKVATVSSKGKVTAKKAGTVKITVASKSNSKIKKVVTVKVKKYVYPKSLTVKASKTTLTGGATAQLKATFSPANTSLTDVTYKTSDSALATVSKNGVVTANKNGRTGTVTITVTAKYKTKANKTLKKTVSLNIVKAGTSDNTNTTGNTQNPNQNNNQNNDQNTNPVPDTQVVLDSGAESAALTITGVAPNPTLTLKATVEPADVSQKVTWSSSDTAIATVGQDGVVTAVGTGTAVITATNEYGASASCSVPVSKSTVAIHDPSIFNDPNSDNYYTIGTGLSMAVSTDLQAWTTVVPFVSQLFTNKISELNPLFEYTGADANAANVWAADLIYNTSMKKYCMYICATCDSSHAYKTAIAMCSADAVTGPYSYEGLLVCADFNKDTIGTTNIVEALGLSSESEIPEYYYDPSESGSGDSAYYKANFPDCIDPAPFYGPDGTLYMVYGSFTCKGGIHILKLDPDTGLRSAGYNYDYEEGVSDPYFGKKITNEAGEGPYIQQVKTDKSPTGYYYYLWTSSGLLRGTGTYKMSMFRSENPDGPYYDITGTPATSGGGSIVAYNYKYSFMPMAYTSMGGNSALVDDDGKIYLVYHNKFEDGSGNPGTHMLKVHQMFVNEDGWLVTAPFEYHKETIAATYADSVVAGDYELVIHNVGTAVNYGSYNYNKSVALQLAADGTVSGGLSGTWSLSGNNVTITAGTTVYKGVVLEQYEDDGNTGNVTSQDKTIVMTLAGSNGVMLWASKVTATDAEATAFDADSISVPAEVSENFDLTVKGLYGSAISWSSDNKAIVIDGTTAVVDPQVEATTVTLTAKVVKGSSTLTKNYTVNVEALQLKVSSVIRSDHINLPDKLGEIPVTWETSDASVIALDGTVTQPETGYATVTLTATIGTATQTYDVVVLPKTIAGYLYEEDFTGATDASLYMTSLNYQDGVKIMPDADYGEYLEFSAGNQNSRGAVSDFGVSEQANSIYTVEFDVMLRAGTDQTTEFALAGTDMAYVGDVVNNGIESGYIFKLSSDKSTTWTLNDGSETVELPDNWVHVVAIVDTVHGKANLTISGGNVVYYDSTVKINGTGALKGFYLRSGRYSALFKMDNIKVY